MGKVYFYGVRLKFILLFFFSISAEIITFDKVENIVKKECLNYEHKIINKNLIHAIMYYESRIPGTETFDTEAVSVDKCAGLMQVSKIGLQHYNDVNKTQYKYNDLFIPDINIKIGVWILWHWLAVNKYCIYKSLQKYSGGAVEYENKVMQKMIELYIDNQR